jgi:hypothetical protein
MTPYYCYIIVRHVLTDPASVNILAFFGTIIFAVAIAVVAIVLERLYIVIKFVSNQPSMEAGND